MRVELRQGLYGDMAVSRGLLCPSPGPRGGGWHPGRGGDSPRQPARGSDGDATGAPLLGGWSTQLAGWTWWVGRGRGRRSVGMGGVGTGAGPRCARVGDQSVTGCWASGSSRPGAASREGIDQLVDWPAAEVVLGTHRERRGGPRGGVSRRGGAWTGSGGGFVRFRVEPWWVGSMGGGYISRKMVWVSGDIYLHRLEPEYI